jgi:hypothetical protein
MVGSCAAQLKQWFRETLSLMPTGEAIPIAKITVESRKVSPGITRTQSLSALGGKFRNSRQPRNSG